MKVRVFLTSGQTIDIEGDEFATRRESGTNDLTSFRGEGTKGWPLYLRLSAVVAIQEVSE